MSVTVVGLREIEVSQRGLRHPECVLGILQTLMSEGEEVLDPITLIPYPGKWVISDGHHRAVALHLFHMRNPGKLLVSDVHFRIVPYDKRFKKRTFGSIADLLRRVTYATSSTRKARPASGEHSQDRNPQSPSCSDRR